MKNKLKLKDKIFALVVGVGIVISIIGTSLSIAGLVKSAKEKNRALLNAGYITLAIGLAVSNGANIIYSLSNKKEKQEIEYDEGK